MSVFRVETLKDGSMKMELLISPGRHTAQDIERARKILDLADEREPALPEQALPEEALPEQALPEEVSPEAETETEPVRPEKKTRDANGRVLSSSVNELYDKHTAAARVPENSPYVIGSARGIDGKHYVLCHQSKTSKALFHTHGGGFGVYNVDPEGYILPERAVPADRRMGSSRAGAIERFKAWCEENFCSSVNVAEGEEIRG